MVNAVAPCFSSRTCPQEQEAARIVDEEPID